ncbi:FadR/GntR family transcriptional regulator [Caldinitratiruptor microaerophilus]|uniref:GntR family transcriptional regulator n=1 Tax=Caldinitratiruptor microaerophilus TaxID=671077 RepID=A0AA35CJ66_9FIRM|nr:FadR/GntR family transcriptional regulator [Caldinitratiruptor microaerophilus]BDG60182.1 GntR family transcriptional regulator [Caldinitratiruptor microaerophilus]
MLEPIKRVSVSAVIVDRIRQSIESGSLRPGDRLPPERDMARQLGVSRLSVREAIKVLEAMGLVEVRPGDGTFVRRATAENLVDPVLLGHLVEEGTTLAELVEVRMVLEVEMASLAAGRATPEDIEAMESALRRMEEQIGRGEDFLEADREFHAAVCDATRNAVLARMYEGIMDLVTHLRRRTWRVPGAPERAVASHRAILDAIRARDPSRARAAMREHMANVRRDLEVVMGQEMTAEGGADRADR